MIPIEGFKDALEEIEPGMYEARVDAIEAKTSRAGNPMVVFRWILTGDTRFQGRAVFERFMVSMDLGDIGMRKLGQTLRALDVEDAISDDGFDDDAVVGAECHLVLVQETLDDGRITVNVTRHSPVN